MTKDKTHIWIIGASAGIGAACAKDFAHAGHSIALSARNESALTELRDTLPAKNNHLVVPFDVRDRAATQNAADRILEEWGHFDRVIFMAGLYQPMRMGALDLRETKNILDVNLLGAFHVAESVLPALLSAQGRQQLAFCASVAGYRGLPNSQPYGASKAGLINMVESLKAEYGTQIDIRLINPGFVESRLTDKNDFHMPMRISAESAAKSIVKGLNSKAFEIHFPKRFTFLVKLLGLLPHALYYRLVRP